MTEATRKEAEDAARREVSAYSVTVLGYDRDNPGDDPKPRELLEWVRQRQERNAKVQKWMGAALLAIAAAVGTAVMAKISPMLTTFLGL